MERVEGFRDAMKMGFVEMVRIAEDVRGQVTRSATRTPAHMVKRSP